MTDLGELSLWIALLMAVWGAALSLAGGRLRREELAASGRRGLYAAAGFVALASAALWWALFTGDAGLRYVAWHSRDDLPAIYRFSAFWAGPEGSMLGWSLALSAVAATLVRGGGRARRELAPWIASAIGAALACVLAMNALLLDPFRRLEGPASHGSGVDPASLTWPAVVEAPLLYAGYMVALGALVIAFVIVARRRLDAEAEGAIRRWLAVAWCLLSGGSLLGLRRLYVARGSFGLGDWHPMVLGGAGSRFSVHTAVLTAAAGLVAGALLHQVRVRVIEAGAAPSRASRRRRAARYTCIAGAVVLLGGLIAGAFGRSYTVGLRDGATYAAADPWGAAWTFTSQGVSRLERPDHYAVVVALLPTRNGARARFMLSEQREYLEDDDRAEPPRATVPGIRAGLIEDVYVRLDGAEEATSRLLIRFIPFASFVWIGGVLALVGGAMMLWPDPVPRGALA